MSQTRWQRIGSAFDRLVDLPAKERETRLASLAEADPDVHAEVEA